MENDNLIKQQIVKEVFNNNKRRISDYRRKNPNRILLEKEILFTKRVVKVTKGGRRFSIAALILMRNPEKNSVAFVYVSGKEMSVVLRKAMNQDKKKLLAYFPVPARTIPTQIVVKYKATTLFMKPTPNGNGIKAGGMLNTLFKYLQIQDISTKVIGARNKLNVIRAAFIALDRLTNKKYNY